jgi:diaminohydroxyphosphoribosylaminopyrimidine deaminase / 5-amino-6-(5-phosphoribosylamino)uracil reductase
MNPVVSYIKQTLQGYYPDSELVPMAKLLLTQVFGMSVVELYAGKDTTFSVNERKQLDDILVRLQKLEPIQYIIGTEESADGFIDINRTGGKPIILSNPLTSMLVHKKRAEHDAILVGRHTALLDNPSLSTRNWYGKHPVRLVIDKELTLPRDLELFNGKIKTFVFTRESPCQPNALTEYISLDFNKDILPQIMEVLYQKKIQSLLVEGGSILLQSFIDSGLWDEAFIEKAPLRLNNGIQAPSIQKKHFKLNKIYFGREIMHAVHSQIQR